jgi:circadian clock protein KaiB
MAETLPARLRFRLYVASGQVGSARAEPDLRSALDRLLPGGYELEVVGIQARPDLAAADHVLVAPTVLRLSPPLLRAIGSFEDRAAVAAALGLKEKDG